MAIYQSMYKGAQMDAADTLSLNPDATPTENSTNLVTSGGVFSAIGAVTENSAPAILNTASGAVCSFADGSASPMTSVIAEIVASQAGSGDPYPAGGGKNKFDPAWLLAAAGWSESGGVYSGGISDLNTLYGANTSGLPFSALPYAGQLAISFDYYGSATSRIGYVIFEYSDSTNTYVELSAQSAFTHKSLVSTAGKTVSAIRITRSNAQTLYLQNVQLEYGSTATAYAPYSNIRPISGYTGANVTRAAVNLLKAKYGVRTHRYVTFTPNADGSIKVQGTCSGGVATSSTNLFNPLNTAQMTYLPAGTYIISPYNPVPGETGITLQLSARYLSDLTADVGGTKVGDTVVYNFTEPVYCYPLIRVNPSVTVDATVYPMIELGSTAHAYEAYNGTVYTADWSAHGEVFFGTADVVSGEGVDAGGKWQGAADTAYGTYTTGGGVHTANVHGIGMASGDSLLMCEQAVVIPAQSGASAFAGAAVATGATFVIGKNSSTDYLYFYHKDATDTTDLVNKLHSILPTVIYTKATPPAFTFAGQEIASRLGQNNVWNDVGGDTSVEYRADTKLYIQSLLGA